MDVYERARRGYIQRCRENIAINLAKFKFLSDMNDMYLEGLLAPDEWRELFEMVEV